jgi:LmbE family N-acetylglucosaminyl deacetylase
MRRTFLIALLFVVAVSSPRSQFQLQPVSALRGAPGLELALRKLDTVGTFMMTTAHPDDENNGMLAYFAHGKGYRTTLVTATHGEGGQNEIGPELFEALAVLRTEELAAAHRFDGAEQFFTRAIDFGYSFSIEETLAKWGKEEILGDFVRTIRTIRPDVMVGFAYDGEGGGQHHQTSTRLALEAFRAAADPARYPEQIEEGLRPWQAKKFYYTAGFGGPGGPGPGGPGGGGRGGAGRGGPVAGPPAVLPGEGAPTLLSFAGGDEFDPVLGRTYGEIAGEARSMHKCQGMSQLLPLPGGGGPFGGGGPRAYRLRDTVLDGGVARREREIFDGVDASLRGLLAFAGSSAPADLGTRLDTIAAEVAGARRALAQGGTGAAVLPLTRGLKALRDLRAALGAMGLSESARFEIGFRLAQKEPQFANALLLASDVRLDAVAADPLVVPGQSVQVDVVAANRGTRPVEISAAIDGFNGGPQAACDAAQGPVAAASQRTCRQAPTVPSNANPTAAHFRKGTEGERYVFDADVPFGLPFRPTPFTATFNVTIEGTPVSVTLPIQARTEGDIFSGEKRHEIHVVPAFAVSVTPEIAVVPTRATPANARGTAKEVRVSVVNHARGAAKAEVTLDLPAGWTATPATQAVAFSREDEATTARFMLMAPPPPMLAAAAQKPGGNQFTVKAIVRADGKTYAQGYQRIEYPHTTRRHVLREPSLLVKALDVQVKPGLIVGYVMGVGDEVPQALEQIGVSLSFITPEEMAWGDLTKYNLIVTGVRAYERRADLRAYNNRLLDYVRAGGTAIVQYNKFEFNEAQYGPYPARVGRERVTDENAEFKVLAPQHPIFTAPNAISRADWTGWVQERGLYFLDTEGRDAQMVDLVEFNDPFEYNKGTKLGALVEARVGQGRWIYVGLGLWRQLPAGTDGAYRLMANLLSLGK